MNREPNELSAIRVESMLHQQLDLPEIDGPQIDGQFFHVRHKKPRKHLYGWPRPSYGEWMAVSRALEFASEQSTVFFFTLSQWHAWKRKAPDSWSEATCSRTSARSSSARAGETHPHTAHCTTLMSIESFD